MNGLFVFSNQKTASSLVFFFFQAEDGIRDYKVTGVQTCALPISRGAARLFPLRDAAGHPGLVARSDAEEYGRLEHRCVVRCPGRRRRIGTAARRAGRRPLWPAGYLLFPRRDNRHRQPVRPLGTKNRATAVILVRKTETYSLKRKELCGGLRQSVLS